MSLPRLVNGTVLSGGPPTCGAVHTKRTQCGHVHLVLVQPGLLFHKRQAGLAPEVALIFCRPSHSSSGTRRGLSPSCLPRPCLSSFCGEVEDVVSVLTPVVGGVAQVFHDLLVELRLLLVAEVEEGEEEDRQEEEGWEVESGVGRVKERQPCMAWRWM